MSAVNLKLPPDKVIHHWYKDYKFKDFKAYFSISSCDRSTTARPMGSSFPTRSKSSTFKIRGTVMSSMGTQNFSFH